MLSKLDWKSLSHHGKCTVPDDYDPCPNRNHPPHFPSTRTTTTTTVPVEEEPPPEIQTERPNLSEASQINTVEQDFILSKKIEYVSESKVYFVIAAIVIAVVISLIGIGYCHFQKKKSQQNPTKKEQSDFTKPKESSRTDPPTDYYDSLHHEMPFRSAHFENQNELIPKSSNANRPPPCRRATTASLSYNNDDPNYSDSPNSSSGISEYASNNQAEIHITVGFPVPAIVAHQASNFERSNQFQTSLPEQPFVGFVPSYLNAPVH